MTKNYYTYRIRVTNNERVQVEKWNAQHQLLGEPTGAFCSKVNLEKITPQLQIANSNELKNSRQARALGETLFNALFDNVLRQDFVDFHYEVVQKEKQLLRVELNIDEQGMPAVAALPWEFMCLPADANLGDIWLGTDPNLVFSRRRPQWNSAPPIQLERGEKLRIALAIAAPQDLGAVAYQEVQTMLEALANEQSERVELLPVVNPATSNAIDAVLEKQPHIFHFIGHGRLQNEDREDVGEIALVKKVLNTASWVDASSFGELFNRHRPGIVLLQACEGAMGSASQAFVGVASKIVQQNIPVVVAMQYEVSNITASQFAYDFYERLAKDAPVDIAAQNGRRKIALDTQYRKRDFATPTIFMRVENGYLFKRPNTDHEQNIQNEQNSQSAGKGLNALIELMKVPEMQTAVSKFSNDFQVACEQIEVVANYKDLHDLLHILEFECYSQIIQLVKRFPDADDPSLGDYEIKLQDIVSKIRDVVKHEILPNREVNWIDELAQAHQALRGALDELDIQQLNVSPEAAPATALSKLKTAIWLINRVLAIQPSYINAKLTSAARALRLPAIVNATSYIRDNKLAGMALNREKAEQFQDGVDALISLNHNFTILVENHNDWQEVDLELRRIEANSKQDTFELEMSWSYLKARTEPLYSNSVDTWAESIKKDSKELDSAIASKNPHKIKQCFRSYRRRAGLRFFQVDVDLKRLCGELRKVGEPLASVAKILTKLSNASADGLISASFELM